MTSTLSNIGGPIQVMPRMLYPSKLSMDGVEGLQNDLANALDKDLSSIESQQVIDIISEFQKQDADLIEALEKLATTARGELSVQAAALLAQNPALRVKYSSLLLDMLIDNHDNAIASTPMEEVLGVIATDDNPADSSRLQSLAKDSNGALHVFSLAALRKLKLRNLVPFWIALLDSQSRNDQYEAVISLAELNGMYGEYAPSLQAFTLDPTKYVRLWSIWAKTQPTQVKSVKS